MGCINHNQVTASVDQRLRAFKARVPYGRRGSNPQTAQIVFAGIGVENGLFNILNRQKPRQVTCLVHDQQFF